MRLIKSNTDDPALTIWQRTALESFCKKVSNQDELFPCIPATQGHALNHFRYGFAGNPDDECTAEEVASLLKEFTIHSREFGSYTSLIVFLDTSEEMVEDGSVEYFEELFWKLLNRMAAVDEKDWVDPITVNPESPLWEYCFHGEKYFIYCATPAHTNRKSRHFPVFMLAITPRWVLNGFHSNKNYADRLKTKIRTRLITYDSIPPHHDLNEYGAFDNHEWKQYFLRDDPTSLGSCPFSRKR